VTVNGLPTNGETIYVRLNAVTNGVAVQTDCTYTAVTEAQAALTSPAPGSTLAGATATFTWTPAAGATSYSLWLGSTGVGSSDLYNSHSITATSATVSGLPTNGETIYARLNVITNGIAVHTDYTYTAAR
jgi:ribosomal protein S8E